MYVSCKCHDVYYVIVRAYVCYVLKGMSNVKVCRKALTNFSNSCQFLVITRYSMILYYGTGMSKVFWF